MAVLLSILVRFKSTGIKFNGNFPRDGSGRKAFLSSGFLNILYHQKYEEQDEYEVSASFGIHTHGGKCVDARLGATLIENATKALWGTPMRCQGVQRTLIELMLNTNNHAAPSDQGTKHWWVTVRHQPQSQVAQFAFLDFGIGVFTSLANKPEGSRWRSALAALRQLITGESNAELLKLILEGTVHQSVTGEGYRGKGLPGIALALRRGQLSRLVIVTNDVYADVSEGIYKTLKTPFRGTLVYWELTKANAHHEG